MFPGQPYCSHPPHCTLIHTHVNKVPIEDQIGGEGIVSIKPFKIQVSGTDVFWNDAATGGHTLYLKIIPSIALKELQLRVAKAISPIVLPKSAPDFIENNLDFKMSFEKYGFPFVGSHWIPHFSVASIRTDSSNSLIEEFISWNSVFEFVIGEVSLWRIESDNHIRIQSYSFKP